MDLARILQGGGGPDIQAISSQTCPEFRFEYHARAKKLYRIKVGEHMAFLIVEGVGTPEQAKQIVRVFAEGYRAALQAVSAVIERKEIEKQNLAIMNKSGDNEFNGVST